MIVKLKPNSTGSSSFILHEKAQPYFWEGVQSLSIKSFHGCEATYDIGRGRFKIDQGSYLILNQGRHYSISVDAESSGESFCLFFEDGLAEEVNYSLTALPMTLLDNPIEPSITSIGFFEKTYRHDEILTPALIGFKDSLAEMAGNPVWVAERLREVMQRLLRVHQAVCREVNALPAMRPATREELYRRLYLAKDFMIAALDQPLTIDEMAGVACLSPNHFIRSFRQIFHQTPHQFLVGRRLERAQLLLRRTDLSVTEICLAVGFESLGSFSSLFRRKLGISPEKFRREKGDFKEAD